MSLTNRNFRLKRELKDPEKVIKRRIIKKKVGKKQEVIEIVTVQ
jgi:hypothetical protein